MSRPAKLTLFLSAAGLLLILLAAGGYHHYRSQTAHLRLFDEYFDARPAGGYGVPRALVSPLKPAAVADQDASILRQAIAYHQTGEFAGALAASRAWLESNPAPRDHRAHLLGATAAVEVGEYATARALLDDLPQGEPALGLERDYYLGLLDVYEGELARAATRLERVAQAGLGFRRGRAVALLERVRALAAARGRG